MRSGAYVLQKRKATGEKPFDYDRALNQISAVIGIRPGEEFEYEDPNDQQEAKQREDFRAGRGPA